MNAVAANPTDPTVSQAETFLDLSSKNEQSKIALFEIMISTMRTLDLFSLLLDNDSDEFLNIFKAFADEECFVIEGVDWGADIYKRHVAALLKIRELESKAIAA